MTGTFHLTFFSYPSLPMMITLLTPISQPKCFWILVFWRFLVQLNVIFSNTTGSTRAGLNFYIPKYVHMPFKTYIYIHNHPSSQFRLRFLLGNQFNSREALLSVRYIGSSRHDAPFQLRKSFLNDFSGSFQLISIREDLK